MWRIVYSYIIQYAIVCAFKLSVRACMYQQRRPNAKHKWILQSPKLVGYPMIQQKENSAATSPGEIELSQSDPCLWAILRGIHSDSLISLRSNHVKSVLSMLTPCVMELLSFEAGRWSSSPHCPQCPVMAVRSRNIQLHRPCGDGAQIGGWCWRRQSHLRESPSSDIVAWYFQPPPLPKTESKTLSNYAAVLSHGFLEVVALHGTTLGQIGSSQQDLALGPFYKSAPKAAVEQGLAPNDLVFNYNVLVSFCWSYTNSMYMISVHSITINALKKDG